MSVVAADDLAAARVVGARQQRVQLVVGELVVAQQRHRRGRHLAQVVARHLGGQAHRDARRAVEQHERQACRQQRRLVGRAVVVGHEVDRAFVEFVEQQAGDRAQARFGVAHRRGAVAIAAAEVAVAVDQRITLREVLRHAHQCVVGRGVAVRMELAEHVAHHARALHRLGCAARAAEAQAHAVHRIQDAPLHRLVAVADVGQRAALDHRQRVLEVGALGVLGQRDGVRPVGRRHQRELFWHLDFTLTSARKAFSQLEFPELSGRRARDRVDHLVAVGQLPLGETMVQQMFAQLGGRRRCGRA